jgi:hypothetical protein
MTSIVPPLRACMAIFSRARAEMRTLFVFGFWFYGVVLVGFFVVCGVGCWGRVVGQRQRRTWLSL